MAAGVIAQAGVKWNTVSDSPSVVQLNPPLRQAAGTMCKIRERILHIGCPLRLLMCLAASRTSTHQPLCAIAGDG